MSELSYLRGRTAMLRDVVHQLSKLVQSNRADHEIVNELSFWLGQTTMECQKQFNETIPETIPEGKS
jgi:hypothetical protein